MIAAIERAPGNGPSLLVSLARAVRSLFRRMRGKATPPR
jgi:hypothetical protein